MTYPEPYSTHQQALVRMLMRTSGPALEMGIGEYSSVVAHEILQSQNRYFRTVTQDWAWYNKYQFLRTYIDPVHDIRLLSGGKSLTTWQQNLESLLPDLYPRWSVVFVDQAPAAARPWAMRQLKSVTDFFVVHDTERMSQYGYTDIFAEFKYQKTFSRVTPYTTILSDTHKIP